MARFMDKTLQDGYDIGRKETAREIFEEIEDTLEPHIESFTKFHITQKIAELKKKYTE